jgi:hypothetical protein
MPRLSKREQEGSIIGPNSSQEEFARAGQKYLQQLLDETTLIDITNSEHFIHFLHTVVFLGALPPEEKQISHRTIAALYESGLIPEEWSLVGQVSSVVVEYYDKNSDTERNS